MPRVTYRVLLDAPLEAVWAFFEDVERGLSALTPPARRLRLVKVEPPRVGAEMVVAMRAPPLSWVGRETRWTARYVEHRPPHGLPPGRRAWFVDEQVRGPFARWRHAHRFEEIMDAGRTKVWAIDELDYAVPLGPLGVVANKLVVRRMLDDTFAFRHRVMRERLCRR